MLLDNKTMSLLQKHLTDTVIKSKFIFTFLQTFFIIVSLYICNQTLPGASHSKRSFEITTGNLPASLVMEELFQQKATCLNC